MVALLRKRQHQRLLSGNGTDHKKPIDPSTLRLGQLVLVRRRPCMLSSGIDTQDVGQRLSKNAKGAKPTKKADDIRLAPATPILGVVVEKKMIADYSATIRLRSIVMQTGVEWILPLESPLIESVQILREPKKDFEATLPNLLGCRSTPEAMGDIVDGAVMTEKAKAAFLASLHE